MVDFVSPRMRTNRRKARRQPLDYPAWIDTGDELALRDCRISDITDAGAKLLLGAQDDIPDEFRLILVARTGMGRRCRVVRRTEQEIGVVFHEPATSERRRDYALRQLDC